MTPAKSNEVLITEMNYMKEEMKEIKTTLKEFISSADNKYATKEQHIANLERITKIEWILNKLTWTIVIAVVWAAIQLVIRT